MMLKSSALTLLNGLLVIR